MWKTLILLVAVLMTACSQDAPEDQTVATQPPAVNMEPCEDRTPEPPPQAEASSVGNQKPKVQAPDGPPPCKLVVQDIVDGSGAEAEAGSTLTVQYVGMSWSTGQEFEASWGGPQPPTFQLSGVIRGWQEGLPGMKEGGRRQLIIPPGLAYGAQGSPPRIAPNETLVFVIDLLKVA
ncbi:MAG TPA: FKBP-type peptidyl-prolyl cis-trans isomerase [Actinomycetota bacterium]|jgi:peptidylprolyl isomerase|nr:FKBP-type peptidyl-prolyl cis-trans isomerase [Actinomycetota bacterium]